MTSRVMSSRATSVAKMSRKRKEYARERQGWHKERGPRRGEGTRVTQPRFPCPFTARSLNGSTCQKGYCDISRLKEHLRRRHTIMKPLFLCERCYAGFETTAERRDHYRSVVACDLSNVPKASNEVISKETNDALNRRIKRRDTPEEAWMHIYRTIFPDVPRDEVPTPWLLPLRGVANRLDESMEISSPESSPPPSLSQDNTNAAVVSHAGMQRLFAEVVPGSPRTTEGCVLGRDGTAEFHGPDSTAVCGHDRLYNSNDMFVPISDPALPSNTAYPPISSPSNRQSTREEAGLVSDAWLNSTSDDENWLVLDEQFVASDWQIMLPDSYYGSYAGPYRQYPVHPTTLQLQACEVNENENNFVSAQSAGLMLQDSNLSNNEPVNDGIETWEAIHAGDLLPNYWSSDTRAIVARQEALTSCTLVTSSQPMVLTPSFPL